VRLTENPARVSLDELDLPDNSGKYSQLSGRV
jgi:hypothetical protein